MMAAIAVLTGAVLFGFRSRWQDNYTEESNYYSITVRTLEDNLKMLSLDNVVHSYVRPDEPATLISPTLRAFAEIVDYRYANDSNIKVLHLGGGGYTFPRYLELEYPNAVNDVVEIDPAVTRIAYTELGLPAESAITSYNLDARQFLIERSSAATYKYDIVVSDILYGLSIPYHLVTYEFDALVRANMEPGGVYLAHIIDDYTRGRFMASVVRTLQQAFGNVYLFSLQPEWQHAGSSSYVVAATDSRIDLVRGSGHTVPGQTAWRWLTPTTLPALTNTFPKEKRFCLLMTTPPRTSCSQRGCARRPLLLCWRSA